MSFGGNRRILGDGKWAGFGFQRNGPVDHSLPVLAARDADGKVRAIWANYACHCTTVGSRNHVGGDWAGYANQRIEEKFGSAVALMTIGCGADIGPQPSGSLKDADRHGLSIAEEVQSLAKGAIHNPVWTSEGFKANHSTATDPTKAAAVLGDETQRGGL